MTASKRFAKVVAKCRANFEKNSELVARKTKRRRWDPRTPGMNCPVVHGKYTNYFNYLRESNLATGLSCKDVNPDNAQKLRWCGLVETDFVNGIACYFATNLGKAYIEAVEDCIMEGIF